MLDTYTTGALARELTTSVPRVHRAIRRLGIEPDHTPGGHARLSASEAAALRRELGTRPAVPGLSHSEALVAATLGRHPLGLSSARAVARAAGLSATTASTTLRELERRGIASHDEQVVVEGRARTVRLWSARYESRSWLAVAAGISRTCLPPPANRPRPRRLPRRLFHLFWNVPRPGQIDLFTDGVTVAHRILTSHDPQAFAWAAESLPPDVLRRAAAFRDVDARSAALAENLCG